MKKSFFERITGTISLNGRGSDFEEEVEVEATQENPFSQWETAEAPEGELAVDVYQTNDSIVIQAMVAGVASEDLSVSVTREMVTIKGKREAPKGIASENYFYQELYWGAFSRTILLPAEVETEDVEATEKHGLLTVKLPKIDKEKKATVKIKSL
ncbi:protein containing Heat shock protein Hsp20 domain [sediment metagenome]|uniref:Protein containing Heat shock protein Hsp20 domain n=1 Tax=sediment metagenome TaxID=749907 RepID=D9PF62_9ZZZZ